MASVLNWLWELEESYSTHESIKWAAANPDIPVFAVCSYLIVVFYIPAYIKTPFKLRNVWALWNLLLSAFSIRGAMVTVPHLITTLQTQGFHFTLCEEPESWYLNGKPGFWYVQTRLPVLLPLCRSGMLRCTLRCTLHLPVTCVLCCACAVRQPCARRARAVQSSAVSPLGLSLF
jgi:hypothetical protein